MKQRLTSTADQRLICQKSTDIPPLYNALPNAATHGGMPSLPNCGAAYVYQPHHRQPLLQKIQHRAGIYCSIALLSTNATARAGIGFLPAQKTPGLSVILSRNWGLLTPASSLQCSPPTVGGAAGEGSGGASASFLRKGNVG